MYSDAYSASNRARGAVNPLNAHVDYSNPFAYPILYELKMDGVTVDIRPNATGFDQSREKTGLIYKHDRLRGTKVLFDTLPPRK